MSVFVCVAIVYILCCAQVQSFQIHTTMTTRCRISLSSSITDQTDTNTDSNMATQLKDDLIALAASTNRGVSLYQMQDTLTYPFHFYHITLLTNIYSSLLLEVKGTKQRLLLITYQSILQHPSQPLHTTKMEKISIPLLH